MKKLLIILLVGVVAVRCDDSHDFYNDSKKDGKWAWYMPENSGNGVWLPFQNEIVVIEDISSLTGQVKFFYPSGVLESIQTYKNGVLDGYYCSYYENQNKKQEGTRLNNAATDTLVEWYENGQMKFKRYYEDGKKQGKAYIWHKSGMIWVEGTFKDDLKNGNYKIYDNNGQLRENGEYRLDKKIGEWNYFNENGDTLKQQ